MIHVVTRFDSDSNHVSGDANLPDADGTGQTSGLAYHANGAERFIPVDPVIPGNPIFMTVPGFTLIPPDPVRGGDFIFSFRLGLVFFANGNLDAASSAAMPMAPNNGP